MHRSKCCSRGSRTPRGWRTGRECDHNAADRSGRTAGVRLGTAGRAVAERMCAAIGPAGLVIPAVLVGVSYAGAFLLLQRCWPTPHPLAERVAALVATLVLLATLAMASRPRPARAALVLLLPPLLLLSRAPAQSDLAAAVLPIGLLPLLASAWLRQPLRRLLQVLVVGSSIALAGGVLLASPSCHARVLAIAAALGRAIPSVGRLDPESLLLPAFLLVGAVVAADQVRGGTRASRRGWAAVLAGLVVLQVLHRDPRVGTALLAAALAWSCRGACLGVVDGAERRIERRGPLLALAGCVAALVVVLAVDRFAARRFAPGAVGFLASSTTSLAAPEDDGAPGLPFGMWRSYLEKSGVATAIVPSPITAEGLAGVRALVLINHNRPLAMAEGELVDGFVRDGGTLLVLADHTDVMGQLRPTNALIGRYGIALRPDTAVPIDRPWNWRGALRATLHPATLGVPDATRYAWGLGCSLELSRDATPLLTAARGFSDRGNAKDVKRAGLGDLTLGRGERREGVVLAAEARVGRGRVLVFGDTSAFQDACLPRAYPLVAQVTGHALCGSRPSIPLTTASTVIAGALAILLFLRRRGAAGDGGAWLCVGVVSGAAFGLGLGLDPDRPDILPEPRHIAWVDLSRGSPASTKSPSRWSIAGLDHALAATGRLPLHLRDGVIGQLADRPGALIVPAPRTGWSADELAAVEHYLQSGGTVWVLAGCREFAAAPELLARFGVAIGDLPLGTAPGACSVAGGAPVEAAEAWPVLADQAVTVATAWEHRLAVRKAVGDGQLLVVGDPGLFLGDGLEQSKKINESNQAFFAELVADWRNDT